MKQKQGIIYICTTNRLHLQSVTKTVPCTNYFWSALLLTLLHSCTIVCCTSTTTKHIYNNLSYDYATSWSQWHSTGSPTHCFQLIVIGLFTYSLNTLSLACSLAHSCSHTLSWALASSLTRLLNLLLLAHSFMSLSFSHLLTPSNSFSLAYSFPNKLSLAQSLIPPNWPSFACPLISSKLSHFPTYSVLWSHWLISKTHTHLLSHAFLSTHFHLLTH